MKIQNDIEKIILNNPKTSFFKIADTIQKDNLVINTLDIIDNNSPPENKFANIISKQIIGDAIRALENDKKIVNINNNYYHTDLFKNEIGYTSWGLNGACFVTSDDITNDYGLNFNTKDNQVSVINKKEADLKTQYIYKEIPLDIEGHVVLDSALQETIKTQAFLTKKLNTQNHNLIVSLTENNKIMVLNHGFQKELKTENFSEEHINIIKNSEANDIFVVNVNIDFNHLNIDSTPIINYNIIEKIGNITDKGVEPYLVKKLTDVKDYYQTHQFPITDMKPLSDYKDLTHLSFSTIDSIYTKDIDDAIYAEKTASGFNLFVAIADVSSYVLKSDELDLIAKDAATTFYLPLDTIHMLPKTLSQDKCSLNPNEIKKSMVAEIKLDLDAKIESYQFYQAHINSHARFTYKDIDLLLNNDKASESKIVKENQLFDIQELEQTTDSHLAKIMSSIKTLDEIVKLLPIKEQLYTQQPDMHIGEHGKIEFMYYENQESASQKIVENSMMMANKVAAQLIHDKYPQFGLFRNQLKPEDAEGLKLKAAYYHNENEGHFGLESDFYTHFTSPIRRYCDLINHRLIKDIIQGDMRNYDMEELLDISTHINVQNYKAKQADIKIKNIFINEYINELIAKNQLDKEFTIREIKENGFVFINKQLIELFIPTFKIDYSILKDIKKYQDDYTAQKQHIDKKYDIVINIKPYHFSLQKRDLDVVYTKKPQLTSTP